jgi:hypothetical protein
VEWFFSATTALTHKEWLSHTAMAAMSTVMPVAA